MTPTRVLVLGGGGMLGHKLAQRLIPRCETLATVRNASWAWPEVLPPDRVLVGVDALSEESVARALDRAAPTVVVNCIGIVKQHPSSRDAELCTAVNSLFPHRLHRLCRDRGARLIHVSTDCVFSGARGCYREDDLPDPPDLYGRTKLAGEPVGTAGTSGADALTLRVSLLGRELAGRRGLLEWLLGGRGGEVDGYTRAVFNGLSTAAFADLVSHLLRRDLPAGLLHAGGEPIAKAELLWLLNDAFDLRIRVVPRAAPVLDRSLATGALVAATDWRAPSWSAMLAELAADTTPYTDQREMHAHR